MLRLIAAGVLVVFAVCLLVTWRGFGASSTEVEDAEPPEAPATTDPHKSQARNSLALMADPFSFLLGFVPGKKLLVCATAVSTIPRGGADSDRFTVSDRKSQCDVFVTTGADVRVFKRVFCRFRKLTSNSSCVSTD